MVEPNYPKVYNGLVCPPELAHDKLIVLGHGSGGQMTHDLITNIFLKHFSGSTEHIGNDGYILDNPIFSTPGRIVTSTDGHVVDPIFFPGGDIGKLSVCGTVNDISMMGAKPLYLTASFIIEEGFLVGDLERIAISMQAACKEADVTIVAGDTKVVPKGKADKVFISTTGIGWVPEGRIIDGSRAIPGDDIIISGNIGDHGIAILQARGELGFVSEVKSDLSPLNHMIELLINNIPDIHVLRDPTRGGVATTLVEISKQSRVTMELSENSIPITQAVQSAASLFGLDPLYIANEGKVIIILPSQYTEKALTLLHTHQFGKGAQCIGKITGKSEGQVMLETIFGSHRILYMLSGEMLPRIC